MPFAQSLARRLCGSLVVTIAVANMSGCGSSPEMRGHLAESKTSSDLSSKFVASESKGDLSGPVSALEIANAPQKTFSRDKESGALIVTFADLNLKAAIGIEAISEEDVKRFPNWLKALNGEEIRIRGYMLPTFEETGIERFVLDHSPRMMNFGADPKVYELLQVDLVAGTTTDSVRAGRSIEVIGRFRIDLDVEDGTLPILYFLEDASIVASKPEDSTQRMSPVSALEIANGPQKVFLRDQRSGALNVTFADLNLKEVIGVESISEDDVQRFPNWLKALNGEKIHIRGYMFPGFDATGIQPFGQWT